jgi:hypothetical protein
VVYQDLIVGGQLNSKYYDTALYLAKTALNLKVASVSWSDMQGTGHEAVVVYRKCLVTQHIRPNNAPAGFMVFGFEPCAFW